MSTGRFLILMTCMWLGISPCAAETLRDVLLDAIDANPALKSARERVRGAQALVDAAKAGGRPTVSLNSSEGISYLDADRQTTTLGATRQALVVRQPLVSGGQITGDIERTQGNLRAERARLRDAEQQILATVAGTYAALIRDRALLALATAKEKRLKQAFDQTRLRFRFGDVTITDIAQAETRLAGAAHAQAVAEAGVQASEAEFMRLVGRPPSRILLPPPEAPGLPRSQAEAEGLAQDHPSLVATANDVDSARGALAVAKSERRPKVALETQLAYATDPDRYTDRQTEASIGAVVTVPLYQGGGAAAREHAAQAELSRRRYDLEDRRLAVTLNATQAWQTLMLARSSVRALEIQARAAEIAADGVRHEALIGLRTVLDVLDAENELLRPARNWFARKRILSPRAMRSWPPRADWTSGLLASPRTPMPLLNPRIVNLFDILGMYQRSQGKCLFAHSLQNILEPS
ncbi:outer membrane protein [Arboricoccus pini]|uniref:Outer membrane protein n=1 Tax=Arboricoccus pini TaxID=1963835 RepID=A0A212QP90_9PROT|nr:TolC family protein [Arboricoccus pini]SNB61266.1 outer membrane protein [Arboricoccus pini]